MIMLFFRKTKALLVVIYYILIFYIAYLYGYHLFVNTIKDIKPKPDYSINEFLNMYAVCQGIWEKIEFYKNKFGHYPFFLKNNFALGFDEKENALLDKQTLNAKYVTYDARGPELRLASNPDLVGGFVVKWPLAKNMDVPNIQTPSRWLHFRCAYPYAQNKKYKWTTDVPGK